MIYCSNEIQVNQNAHAICKLMTNGEPEIINKTQIKSLCDRVKMKFSNKDNKFIPSDICAKYFFSI